MPNSQNGYLLRGGRVVDGNGGPPIENGQVVVIGERIAWVGEANGLPPEFKEEELEIVDTTGETVMPGIVDGHCHLAFGEAVSEEEVTLYTPVEYRALRAGYHARKVLRAGVTSISDPGTTFNVSVAVREAIESGLIEGPRMAAAGRQLTTYMGLTDNFPNWVGTPSGPGLPESANGVLVRTKDEMVHEVRRQIKDGVDLIKISGSGDWNAWQSINPWNPEVTSAFTLDETKVIVDEAQRLDRKVTTHARSSEAVRFGAEAGVDWVMHASYADLDSIAILLDKKIPVLPALTLLINSLEGVGDELRLSTREALQKEADAAIRYVRAAHEAGVTLIAGSEAGFSVTPYGEWHAREMDIFVHYCDFSPLEAITCGTKNAALTVPKYADDIGVLEVGKLADILVVDGDPTHDIRVLLDQGRRRMVMKGGERVDLETPIKERRVRVFERVRSYPPRVFHVDDWLSAQPEEILA